MDGRSEPRCCYTVSCALLRCSPTHPRRTEDFLRGRSLKGYRRCGTTFLCVFPVFFLCVCACVHVCVPPLPPPQMPLSCATWEQHHPSSPHEPHLSYPHKPRHPKNNMVEPLRFGQVLLPMSQALNPCCPLQSHLSAPQEMILSIAPLDPCFVSRLSISHAAFFSWTSLSIAFQKQL